MAGAGASTSTQGVIAAARIARVVQATSRAWSPQVAVKAMSRGWSANTGVHLFGKFASRVGPIIPVGVGVYRIWQAENNTERVQAVVGTGAGIAGGYGGAAVGISVGSLILPGSGMKVTHYFFSFLFNLFFFRFHFIFSFIFRFIFSFRSYYLNNNFFVGTVIGGVVGGLLGSFGSQVVAEKVVQQISDEINGDLCIICSQ